MTEAEPLYRPEILAVVDLLATALDDIGARIYRDVNPDSSYEPWDEQTAQKLSDFAAYAEKQLAVLDHPDVKAALAAGKEIEP